MSSTFAAVGSRWDDLLTHPAVVWLNRRRVLISAILFVAMIGEDLYSGIRPHDVTNFRDHYTQAGLIMIVVGLALRSWAVGVVRKSKQLATTGPYRLTRNPLYVGSFLMMFGICALIDDKENIWIVLGPMLFLYYLTVRQEERTLQGLFGEAWTDYARTTPRALIKPTISGLSADWSLERWKISREYRAAATMLLGLVALKIWHGV
jgi:protein-S-isoprenylcysteine O-methyltransferase Ste14